MDTLSDYETSVAHVMKAKTKPLVPLMWES
jgi:hypothetical protein